MVGFEPTTHALRKRCSTTELHRHACLTAVKERVTGIEPVSYPWEGYVLPLNHTRLQFAKATFPLYCILKFTF